MLYVSGSLRERKWTAQNHGLSLARRDQLKNKAAHVFLVPGEWFEPAPQELLQKKKAPSVPRPAALRFGSILCLWVLPVHLVLVSSPFGPQVQSCSGPSPSKGAMLKTFPE